MYTNATHTKKLAKHISGFLKEKGCSDISHSQLLEELAKFSGYKDWNTFNAVGQAAFYSREDKDWAKEQHVHIDNGGYSFSYNETRSLLYIETGFFGYSSNEHLIPMSKSDLRSLIHALERNKAFYKDEDNGDERFFEQGECWKLVDSFSLYFETAMHQVTIMPEKNIIPVLKSFLE